MKIESFRLLPSDALIQEQTAAEVAYNNKASPWIDQNSKTISVTSNPKSGETSSLCDIPAMGLIRTIHILTDVNDISLLKNLWLRMYWDGSPVPSVNVPLLDFFGCGAGLQNVEALQVRATNSGEFTSYFPMPFYRNAKIDIVNMSNAAVNLSAEISYSEENVDRWNQGYFMTQFNESNPARWHIFHHVGSMLGRGKYIGMHIALPDNPPPYYLEGDPIFTIDSNSMNDIRIRGLEDYLNGGRFLWIAHFRIHLEGVLTGGRVLTAFII